MTLSEKISQTPKLERIDSSIDSCIKILKQELNKRKVEVEESEDYVYHALYGLQILETHFNIMRGKK